MLSFPQNILPVILQAIGESDTMIGGQLQTILTKNFFWDDEFFDVAATERWPDAARIRVGSEEMQVSKVSSTRWQVVSRPSVTGSTPPHRSGTQVVDQSREYSAIDLARRQMLTDFAEEEYLDVIARNYGLQRLGFLGTSLNLPDDRFREFIKVAAFLQAGPLWAIMRVVNTLLSPVIVEGTTSAADPQKIDFGFSALPKGFERGLIRINEDWSRTYRVLEIDPALRFVRVWDRPGPTWAGANFDDEVVSVELFPWDVWERDDEPGRFFLKVIQIRVPGFPFGATYLQGGEEQSSSSPLSVITSFPINQVLGVWLATDPFREGTDFFAGGSFVGNSITLGTALPGHPVDVLIDYGSVSPSTAQLLEDETVLNQPTGAYWPAYLSDFAEIFRGVLEIVRDAGFLPRLESNTWIFENESAVEAAFFILWDEPVPIFP